MCASMTKVDLTDSDIDGRLISNLDSIVQCREIFRFISTKYVIIAFTFDVFRRSFHCN